MKLKPPQYVAPPAPAPAQADPAFVALQQQSQKDRESAISAMTERDTAAAMVRYGIRRTLLGSTPATGLFNTPAADPMAQLGFGQRALGEALAGRSISATTT